jgi:uncharacterized damage-inducible protein DinB
MSDILAEHADFMFDAVQGYISGLSEEELKWKPIEESLSIHNILVHTTRIALILIPQVIDGTVKPQGWDDDYEETPHTYDELLEDLGMAREKVVNGLRDMSEEDLERTLKLWDKDLVSKNLIFHLLREVAHHGGQMAMIKGMYKRSLA